MTQDENDLLVAAGITSPIDTWDFGIPLPIKKSSCIAAATYNPFTRNLQIYFVNGDSVGYHVGIPTVIGLLAAESAGGYFNANIRGGSEED